MKNYIGYILVVIFFTQALSATPLIIDDILVPMPTEQEAHFDEFYSLTKKRNFILEDIELQDEILVFLPSSQKFGQMFATLVETAKTSKAVGLFELQKLYDQAVEDTYDPYTVTLLIKTATNLITKKYPSSWLSKQLKRMNELLSEKLDEKRKLIILLFQKLNNDIDFILLGRDFSKSVTSALMKALEPMWKQTYYDSEMSKIHSGECKRNLTVLAKRFIAASERLGTSNRRDNVLTLIKQLNTELIGHIVASRF